MKNSTAKGNRPYREGWDTTAEVLFTAKGCTEQNIKGLYFETPSDSWLSLGALNLFIKSISLYTLYKKHLLISLDSYEKTEVSPDR